MWMLVKDSMALLGRKPRKLGEEFAYQVMGEQAEKARWKQCFSLVKHYMNNVMSALFVEEYFDEQSKFMVSWNLDKRCFCVFNKQWPQINVLPHQPHRPGGFIFWRFYL